MHRLTCTKILKPVHVGYTAATCNQAQGDPWIPQPLTGEKNQDALLMRILPLHALYDIIRIHALCSVKYHKILSFYSCQGWKSIGSVLHELWQVWPSRRDVWWLSGWGYSVCLAAPIKPWCQNIRLWLPRSEIATKTDFCNCCCTVVTLDNF